MTQKTPSLKTQLAVIGAGPGGYAAAFAGADAGMSVTLIDADPELGGVCLNRGCIPSKALLHVASVLNNASEASAFGLKFSKPTIDLTKLQEWKTSVVKTLTSGLISLAKNRNVQLLQGRASFLDARTLKILRPDATETTLAFDSVIIATGSRPASPPFSAPESKRIMTSTEALRLDDIPESLLVVGGGYIGLEMATVYAALGSRITIVEAASSLLPGADADLVAPLAKRLSAHTLLLNTRVNSLAEKDGQILAEFKLADGTTRTEAFSKALIAIGRKPNSSGLDLHNTRVKINDKGFIQTNAQLQTDEPGVYAIGDVIGDPMLAHKASYEARVAIEVITGKPSLLDARAMPAVIFTDPEIAWCGLTETQAKAQNKNVQIAKFPWMASGRSLSLGRKEGLTKVIFDPATQRLLGVGLCGPGAGELIAESCLALEMGATLTDLAWTIHPHPTLSETVFEASEAGLGHSIHLPRANKPK